MSLAAKRRARPQPVMNVTPLVDVVLVLLIIFMVVIPMMETVPAISLPELFHPDAEAKSKTDPYTLSLTSDGQIYFEKELVAAHDVASVLRRANEADVARRLVLRADRDARYAEVRKVFGVCQSIGFPGISLRVNAARREGEP